MFSIFFHLLFIGYATVEFRGEFAYMPLTAMLIWLLVTLVLLLKVLPEYIERSHAEFEYVSFGKSQTILQWFTATWIVLLHVTCDPMNIVFPEISKKFPQSTPMIISIVLYVVIYRLVAKDLKSLHKYILNDEQSVYEFFRARMTFPILFFPPMTLWMFIEDIFQQNPEFAEVQDMQSFIVAPIFFVLLYVFSPNLFNWAWKAEPSDNKELEGDIVELSEKAQAPVSGVKVWNTFNEPLPNAAVAGLFKKFRYVYITNYLLKLFTHSQIKSVLAHELGHLRLGHIWTYMIFSLDLVLLSVGIKMSLYLQYPSFVYEYETINTTLELVLFLVIFIVAFTAIARKSEYQADAFAATITDSEPLAEGLLTLENLVGPPPKRIPKWVMTHPEIKSRVSAIRSWKGGISDIIKEARKIRIGLIILGIIIFVCSMPAFKTMWTVIEASSFRQNNELDNALKKLDSLPASLNTHPLLSREMGRLAATSGRWLTAVVATANAQWNLGVSSEVFSEVLHHPTTPEITFYFKFMKFLL